jgi:hypothetical protein
MVEAARQLSGGPIILAFMISTPLIRVPFGALARNALTQSGNHLWIENPIQGHNLVNVASALFKPKAKAPVIDQ